MFRHILPNALTPVVSFAPFTIVANIGSLVALDFLGFGLPAPTPSWGELIGQGMSNLTKWWLVFFPLGVAVPDAAAGRLHRRSRARGVRSQGILAAAMTTTASTSLLSIRGLRTYFDTEAGRGQGRRRRRPRHRAGEVLGLVGESGSGKSVTALSVLRLIPIRRAGSSAGEILFKGRDLLTLPWDEIRDVRGSEISMIFQEPMTSLNPVFTIGMQVMEVILAARAAARATKPSGAPWTC